MRVVSIISERRATSDALRGKFDEALGRSALESISKAQARADEAERSHESVDSGHIEAVWGTDRSSVAIHKLVYRSSVYFTWINLCIALLFLGAAKGHFVFSKELDDGTTLEVEILDFAGEPPADQGGGGGGGGGGA